MSFVKFLVLSRFSRFFEQIPGYFCTWTENFKSPGFPGFQVPLGTLMFAMLWVWSVSALSLFLSHNQFYWNSLVKNHSKVCLYYDQSLFIRRHGQCHTLVSSNIKQVVHFVQRRSGIFKEHVVWNCFCKQTKQTCMVLGFVPFQKWCVLLWPDMTAWIRMDDCDPWMCATWTPNMNMTVRHECVLQWNLCFKSTPWAHKNWSYMTGGLILEVQKYRNVGACFY